MNDTTKGILAMVVACTVWGLSPLYYAMLRQVPPLEVLAYRALWSLGFFAVVLLVQGRLVLVWRAVTDRTSLWIIALAAVMISANWFGFIYAISVGKGMDASLGYYIFPLVAVLLGQVSFGERLAIGQWAAVVLAAVAVLVLTLGLGVAPYLALWLAFTFGAYGLLKKRLDLGPVVSVTAEVLVLAPLAITLLVVAGTQGGADLRIHALLAFSGPLTAMPLILFSYAARRVRLSTVGLVQYLNPTLQFACAVAVFHEPFTRWHGIAFGLIWFALLIYSVASIYQDKARRKAASTSGTVAAMVT